MAAPAKTVEIGEAGSSGFGGAQGSAVGLENEAAQAVSDAPKLYGPYSHQINKGGLEDIIANSRMLATEARMIAGGRAAVRAAPGEGAFSALDPPKTVIEFMTTQQPVIRTSINNAVRPPAYVPTQADWILPDGAYLDIRLQRVFNPDGSIDIFNFDTR